METGETGSETTQSFAMALTQHLYHVPPTGSPCAYPPGIRIWAIT